MMFVWETLSNWWSVLWHSLGLAGKEGSVILLGLDNAGKTTLLHKLRTGRVQQHAFPPTDRPDTANTNNNRFHYQGVSLQAWDLGGHEVVRHLWADYIAAESSSSSSSLKKQTLAILFLIDATDHERIEEAGYELDHLIHESLLSLSSSSAEAEEANHHPHAKETNEDPAATTTTTTTSSSSSSLPPVAIFLNKCDLEQEAASTADICQRIDWPALQQAYDRDRIALFRGSVWNQEGYPQAFQWMANFF